MCMQLYTYNKSTSKFWLLIQSFFSRSFPFYHCVQLRNLVMLAKNHCGPNRKWFCHSAEIYTVLHLIFVYHIGHHAVQKSNYQWKTCRKTCNIATSYIGQQGKLSLAGLQKCFKLLCTKFWHYFSFAIIFFSLGFLYYYKLVYFVALMFWHPWDQLVRTWLWSTQAMLHGCLQLYTKALASSMFDSFLSMSKTAQWNLHLGPTITRNWM